METCDSWKFVLPSVLFKLSPHFIIDIACSWPVAGLMLYDGPASIRLCLYLLDGDKSLFFETHGGWNILYFGLCLFDKIYLSNFFRTVYSIACSLNDIFEFIPDSIEFEIVHWLHQKPDILYHNQWKHRKWLFHSTFVLLPCHILGSVMGKYVVAVRTKLRNF